MRKVAEEKVYLSDLSLKKLAEAISERIIDNVEVENIEYELFHKIGKELYNLGIEYDHIDTSYCVNGLLAGLKIKQFSRGL